jgi:hypothetical protein
LTWRLGDGARAEVVSLLRATDLASPDFHMERTERLFRRTALKSFGKLLESRIDENPQRLAKGSVCGHCGLGALSPNGWRSKMVISQVGKLDVHRRQQVCDSPKCGKCTYLLDYKLGLERDRWSIGVRRAKIRVGQHRSYGAGAKLLGEVFEMPVSERQLGRVARKEGEAMEAERKSRKPEPASRGRSRK